MVLTPMRAQSRKCLPHGKDRTSGKRQTEDAHVPHACELYSCRFRRAEAMPFSILAVLMTDTVVGAYAEPTASYADLFSFLFRHSRYFRRQSVSAQLTSVPRDQHGKPRRSLGVCVPLLCSPIPFDN